MRKLICFDRRSRDGTYPLPLAAMPNPARDAVALYYNLKEETAAAVLQVYDINGQLVKTFEVEGPKGHIGWDAGGFAHGVYYCKIKQQGKAYPALKLVLMK
ncbi:MAG: T9SS type A sorting domain-containing protein [Phaeodactylibacter sp.]|nr:T9SS type A sorting domain-containing protein [Phaeodactylibacter sp.]